MNICILLHLNIKNDVTVIVKCPHRAKSRNMSSEVLETVGPLGLKSLMGFLCINKCQNNVLLIIFSHFKFYSQQFE